MLLHSILIYSLHIGLLKQVEKWTINFIWSGDITKRKLMTISWSKMCKPINEGGFCIRNVSKFNEASDMKLGWDILYSHDAWAIILRHMVVRQKKTITYHIYSSIWSSIKHNFQTPMDNSSWLLGDGAKIDLWLDA